ncbi:MAG: phosphoribosylamine--glycine ligase [Gemmatimonadaceae bacterium]|nr:phosphoribosylamine--glycine ligase [Gemmatimonadaceae bacterium]
MKILLLGSGGREHAIAWKLLQDDGGLELVAAPGNPGIESLGRCVPVNPTDVAAVVALAQNERPDLVVIGPEAPLAAGVSDALRDKGFRVFGPSKAAAQLESSKRFAKEVMFAAGIPTAGASCHLDAASAKVAIRRRGAPVVVKASGLAAGKGVIVAQTLAEAELAVDRMFEGAFGEAGSEVLVEECLEGEEISLFAITDGEHFVTLVASQDHKRLLEGDVGPNTGGMGAYAPVTVATAEVLAEVSREIITPTLLEMRNRGTPFTGLLYVGLMLTSEGPKVIEYNCRFGDPETQTVLPMLRDSLLDLLMQASEADGMRRSAQPQVRVGASVTTVVASPGYPDAPITGAQIVLPAEAYGVTIFHAGTRRNEDGALVTAGGRVFAVTAVAGSIESAQQASAAVAGAIEFPGRMLRRDIAWREMARRAGAS